MSEGRRPDVEVATGSVLPCWKSESGSRPHGYFVLLPDLFYRSGPYAPMNAKTVFTVPEERKVLMEKFLGLMTPGSIMADRRSTYDPAAAARHWKTLLALLEPLH